MEKIKLADLLDITEYEKIRPESRQEVMDHKKIRRIQLGSEISLTFEDRTTIIFQIQEMMRAERLVHDSQIQAEIDVYNDLIPDQGELSATLFIEITESDQVKEKLHKFLGLTDGESLWLQVGDTKIYATFEEGRAEEDKISSVHYIRFTLTKSVQESLENSAIEAKIGIDQGTYKYTTVLSSDSRKSLINDLRPA
ncbi:MAG: DUF3501 family protein [Candidatus Marinimicrobia bacterium]|nr:DUF3501 family protein [Candidatus Neomarinimicrobiota bacterium]